MKLNNSIKLSILTAGTILFYLLFWRENLGVNSLIFTVLIFGISFWIFPESRKSIPALIVASGTLLSSIIITWHASDLAIFVWIMSIIMLPGFLHNPSLKSFVFGFPESIMSYFTIPKSISGNINFNLKNTSNFKKCWRFAKLTIIPLLVLFIFYWIFKLANPIFDKYTNEMFSKINEWLFKFFENVSFWQFLFILWGFSIISWLIFKSSIKFFADSEKKQSEIILRKRKTKKNHLSDTVVNLSLKLKNEFRSGLILMIMVNFLILIINIIDINWVWINFELTDDINLTQFVHEGTYLLILSIFLSMGIMLYFFRRNQNFYPKKQLLQTVSYIWIAQNTILLISVIIKNLHYINHYGLAYKRIGLFFFLALVIFVLITLFIKIKDKKTVFYLLKTNTLALYIGFVLFAVPDWDNIITKYNLTYCEKNKIDIDFLLDMDEKVFPVLNKNKELL